MGGWVQERGRTKEREGEARRIQRMGEGGRGRGGRRVGEGGGQGGRGEEKGVRGEVGSGLRQKESHGGEKGKILCVRTLGWPCLQSCGRERQIPYCCRG